MKACRLFLSIIVLLAAAGLLDAQTFTNPVLIPTSQVPISVFVVDVNGDGVADLLYEVASFNSTLGSIQTLLGQPSGGYAQGPASAVPLMVGQCHPADINGDGKLDMVCINYIDECDAQVASMLGNGDGSFQPPIYSAPMHSNCLLSSFDPWLYTPADVNADSLPDLTVGDAYNDEFFVLLSDGTGRFHLSYTALPAMVQLYGEVRTADVNGDGKPDLVPSFGPSVWFGKGDGTFTFEANYGAFDSCNLYDLEAAGHLDAICTDPPSTDELAILHGNPNGSFNTTPVASQPLNGGLAALESPTAILDVNGDGIPDILGASSDGLSVLLGQGNLKFNAPTNYAVGTFGPVGSTTSQIVDLNGDGYKDIICVGVGGFYVSYGNKNGTYKAPASFPVSGLLGQVTGVDFNGDGIPDIAATGDQNIELSVGKGDGTFRPYVAVPNGGINFSQANSYRMDIAHGDFKGDGKQDILAIGNPGSYSTTPFGSYILFGNGDGTFSLPMLANGLQGQWDGAFPGSIADINHDGRDDVVGIDTAALGAAHIFVNLSNGDGTFTTVTTQVPTPEGSPVASPTFPAFADFNGDGKLDAVYLDGANAYVLLGNGDGSFNTNALALPIPPFQGQSLQYQPMAVVTGDFDADGNRDFAVLAQVGGSTPQGGVYVFYGNGDAAFSHPVIAGGFSAVYDSIYSADLNKDGRSDLILETTGTKLEFPGNTVGVVLSEPERLFGPESVYIAGVVGVGAIVADVNQDGYPDLLVSNSDYWQTGYSDSSSNSITSLLNLGPQTNPNLAASTTNLIASSQSFVAGTVVTFTATVSGASSGGGAPSGSVRFADQTGVQRSVPLIPSSGAVSTATFATNSLGVGADTMSAAYSGDSVFAPSSAIVSLTSTGLPDIMTFSVTPNPASLGYTSTLTATVANPAGSSAAVPTGSVEFLDGSNIISGTNTLSNGSTTFYFALPSTGQHKLSAVYSGDLIHVANTATQTETVLTTPNLSISTPPSVTTAQVLSAMITVNGGTGNPTPTGSVSLTASVNQGGSGYSSPATTLSNGSATINIPAGTLAVGTYWLTPTYKPDAASSSIYLGTSTIGDYISVTAPPPTIAITGTALTVAPGAMTGNASTITVTPGGGFTGSVALSATITSSPSGARYLPTLSFGSTSPVSITGTGAGTAILTVLTTAPTASARMNPAHRGFPWYETGGAALACILSLGMRPMRRNWRSMLGVLFLVVLGGGVLACGGGGGNGDGTTNPGTTAGTYIVTLSGSAGTTSATSTITLLVQ